MVSVAHARTLRSRSGDRRLCPNCGRSMLRLILDMTREPDVTAVRACVGNGEVHSCGWRGAPWRFGAHNGRRSWR